MSKEPRSLDSVLPKTMLEGVTRQLEDYFDKPLIIHACRPHKGMNGLYMRIVVSEGADTEQFYLTTGAAQPFEILEYLQANNGFPVIAHFERVGRAILLKS